MKALRKGDLVRVYEVRESAGMDYGDSFIGVVAQDYEPSKFEPVMDVVSIQFGSGWRNYHRAQVRKITRNPKRHVFLGEWKRVVVDTWTDSMVFVPYRPYIDKKLLDKPMMMVERRRAKTK